MPRLTGPAGTVCRSSPTPRQNDNSWSDTRGGSRMPELGPYGSVRGALSIRPPKHAASDNHRRSTTRRSSLSSNETPGVSAKRRASAARRWHFSIKWLLCSTVTSVPFFAGSMISCQQQLAAALRASRTRRKDVEFDAHAMLPVQFYFLVRRFVIPTKGGVIPALRPAFPP